MTESPPQPIILRTAAAAPRFDAAAVAALLQDLPGMDRQVLSLAIRPATVHGRTVARPRRRSRNKLAAAGLAACVLGVVAGTVLAPKGQEMKANQLQVLNVAPAAFPAALAGRAVDAPVDRGVANQAGRALLNSAVVITKQVTMQPPADPATRSVSGLATQSDVKPVFGALPSVESAPDASPVVQPSQPTSGQDPCAGAGPGVAELICSDSELQAAEAEMRRSYAVALESGVPADSLDEQQRGWLAVRDTVAEEDPTELLRIYDDRINELHNAARQEQRARVRRPWRRAYR